MTNELVGRTALLLSLVLLVASSVSAEPPRLPRKTRPRRPGLSAEKLQQIDAIVQEGLDQKKMPGCVVLGGRRDKIVLLKAYGNKRLEPTTEAMTADTVFDLASLTKPIATATSVMILVDQGKLKLDEPVATYLPEFAAGGKERVTVRQLLIHVSGLIPDNSIKDYDDGTEKAIQRVFALKPQTPPGERFAYSDMNFVVLGGAHQRTQRPVPPRILPRAHFPAVGNARDDAFFPAKS